MQSEFIKKLLCFPDQLFQSINMFWEGFFPGIGKLVRASGLAVGEILSNPDVFLILKCTEMARQVPVGGIEPGFEGGKINPFIYNKDRHDTESDPAIEILIDMLERIFQSEFLFIVAEIKYGPVYNVHQTKTESPEKEWVRLKNGSEQSGSYLRGSQPGNLNADEFAGIYKSKPVKNQA